jgi:hypothetical protein
MSVDQINQIDYLTQIRELGIDIQQPDIEDLITSVKEGRFEGPSIVSCINGVSRSKDFARWLRKKGLPTVTTKNGGDIQGLRTMDLVSEIGFGDSKIDEEGKVMVEGFKDGFKNWVIFLGDRSGDVLSLPPATQRYVHGAFTQLAQRSGISKFEDVNVFLVWNHEEEVSNALLRPENR